MKLAAKILIIISLLNIFVFTGCETDDSDPKYNFKVMSSNGAFTGYYSVNGGSFKYFTSSPVPGSPIYYSYEKSISSLDTISIDVTADDDTTTKITIYLYDDTDLLKRADVTQVDVETISLYLDYSVTTTE